MVFLPWFGGGGAETTASGSEEDVVDVVAVVVVVVGESRRRRDVQLHGAARERLLRALAGTDISELKIGAFRLGSG